MYRQYLFVQNIKTSSSVDDGPLEPYFNTCTTSQDSHLVQTGTQSQFGVEWVVFFWSKTLNFSLFQPNLGVRKVDLLERYDINKYSISLLKRFRLLYRRKIPVFSIYRVSIRIPSVKTR